MRKSTAGVSYMLTGFAARIAEYRMVRINIQEILIEIKKILSVTKWKFFR